MKKLSPIQQEVMKRLEQGQVASLDGAGRIVVNGEKVCNYQTIQALQDARLVVKIDRWHWKKA